VTKICTPKSCKAKLELSVPCRPGTPAYKLQAKTRRRASNHTIPCALRLQTLPPCPGSGVATSPTVPDPASLLGRAPVLPRVTQLRTLPPYSGGLRCCHVPHGSGPCLPAREGSYAVTCPACLRGMQALRIKKCLAGLPKRLGSHVSKARPQVSEMPDT
jgi:hypothetical protein